MTIAGTRALRLAARPEVMVLDAGLACCSLEVAAAVATGLLRPADAADPAPEATVLVASGTLTAQSAPALAKAWAQVNGPRAAVAFGACASTGGPYWDSPSIVPGLIDAGVPVEVFVPGCPPRPWALAAAIAEAADLVVGAAP